MAKSGKKTAKETADVLKLESKPVNTKADDMEEDDGDDMDMPLSEKQGIVYIGHIPHGFYEKQMKGYFTQFGPIKHLVISRSRKTGKSRGYGFIQFEDSTVAKIAAETMNGYPLMEKVMVAKVVEPEKVHPAIFRHADRKWKHIPWRDVIRSSQEAPKISEQAERRMKKLLSREKAQAAKLAAAGIDYDFPTSYTGMAIEKGMLSIDDASDDGSEEEVQAPVATGKKRKVQAEGSATAQAKPAAVPVAKASAAAGKAAEQANGKPAAASSKAAGRDSVGAASVASKGNASAATPAAIAAAAPGQKRKRSADLEEEVSREAPVAATKAALSSSVRSTASAASAGQSKAAAAAGSSSAASAAAGRPAAKGKAGKDEEADGATKKRVSFGGQLGPTAGSKAEAVKPVLKKTSTTGQAAVAAASAPAAKPKGSAASRPLLQKRK